MVKSKSLRITHKLKIRKKEKRERIRGENRRERANEKRERGEIIK